MPTDPSESPSSQSTSISSSQHKDAVRELIKSHYDRGDHTGWFEALYAWAGDDTAKVPWADKRPNKNLVRWLEREQIRGGGRSAIVVGCGLGDDAELLARYGFAVTAFDLSPSAIDWCTRRFAGSRVKYRAADLFLLPGEWAGAFEFVFEAYTIQALPRSLRERSISAVSSLVAPGGELLVVCRGRDDHDEGGELPWPLSPSEVARFDACGLRRLAFEDYMDDEDPPVRRFRVHFSRPA